jgi:hypothetical protein
MYLLYRPTAAADVGDFFYPTLPKNRALWLYFYA